MHTHIYTHIYHYIIIISLPVPFDRSFITAIMYSVDKLGRQELGTD